MRISDWSSDVCSSDLEGYATEDQLAMLEADTAAWRRTLERLIDDVDDQLAHINDTLHGAERAQVVADFENEIARLEAAYDLLARADDPVAAIAAADPAGAVRLQASWSARQVVVWAEIGRAEWWERVRKSV